VRQSTAYATLVGTLAQKLETTNAETNAIVPVGRNRADMVFASQVPGDHDHAKFDYKEMQIGQSRVGIRAFC
jgi:hypothetical protein